MGQADGVVGQRQVAAQAAGLRPGDQPLADGAREHGGTQTQGGEGDDGRGERRQQDAGDEQRYAEEQPIALSAHALQVPQQERSHAGAPAST